MPIGALGGMPYTGNGIYGIGGYPSESGSQGKTRGVNGGEECQTCKNRKYQDGSDENVSFKAAAHVSPEAAGVRVAAHEAEHVSNAYNKAAQQGGEVVSASVSLHTATCPECGRVYVSGGETRTMIKYPNESNPYQQQRKAQDAAQLKGANIDYLAT
ncbi:MAG: hypothetical protein ACI4DO_05945 [Roseburia sp.]